MIFRDPPTPLPRNRWLVTVDLGKLADYSAILAMEEYRDRGFWALRHADRVARSTPYTEVVRRVAELTLLPAMNGAVEVVVDAGGVGEPVMEMFYQTRLGGGLVPVVLTAGHDAHLDEHGRWLVPKVEIVEALEVMLQADPPRVRIPPTLPFADILTRELGEFRQKLTSSGRVTFDHRLPDSEGGGHGDMAVALAMGCWVAERRPEARITFY